MSRGLGIATFVVSLVRGLTQRSGFDVVWFGDAKYAPDAVSEVCSLDGWPHPLFDSAVGRRRVKGMGLDVFHFTANTGWARPAPVPFVLTIHDLIFMETGWRQSPRQVLGHRYLRRNVAGAAGAAAAVTTISHASAGVIRERLNLAGCTVIHNGVHVPPIETKSRQVAPYVLSFSSRDPRKRLDLAVRGFLAAGIPYELLILGGGGVPRWLDQYTGGAGGRIRVLEYLDSDQLASVVANARALLYPSANEGFGLPVLEAMASGVPVITGLASATQEVGGDAVLNIDASDPVRSIAHHLERLSIEPGLREALANRGRARAAEFSWDAAVDKYVRLYGRVKDSQ